MIVPVEVHIVVTNAYDQTAAHVVPHTTRTIEMPIPSKYRPAPEAGSEEPPTKQDFVVNRVFPITNETFNINKLIYDDVVSRAVQNARSGQNSTLLIGGPKYSGKSEIVFGGDYTGVLHQVINDLLAVDNSFLMGTSLAIRHGQVTDIGTKSKITLKSETVDDAFGYIPAETTKVVIRQASDMPVPHQRQGDAGYIFQLYFVRNVDPGQRDKRKELISVFTIALLPTFASPLNPDLQHLIHCVDGITEGKSVGMRGHPLTSVLENSLSGNAQLTCIGSLAPNPTNDVVMTGSYLLMDFLTRVSRVNQVRSYNKNHPPKWFTELPSVIPQLHNNYVDAVSGWHRQGLAEGYSAGRTVAVRMQSTAHHAVDGYVNKEQERCAKDMDFNRDAVVTLHTAKAGAVDDLVEQEQAATATTLERIDHLGHVVEEAEEEYKQLREAQKECVAYTEGAPIRVRERDRMTVRVKRMREEVETFDEAATGFETQRDVGVAKCADVCSSVAALRKTEELRATLKSVVAECNKCEMLLAEAAGTVRVAQEAGVSPIPTKHCGKDLAMIKEVRLARLRELERQLQECRPPVEHFSPPPTSRTPMRA